MDLESKRPSGPLFRVGRDRDAWAVPDWAYAKEDGTFGNRFDDDRAVSQTHDDQIGAELLRASQDRMHLTAGYQLGIWKYPGPGHLLFRVLVKLRTFLQLCVLPNVGEDGGHREREAAGKGLKNDDHF